MTDRRGHTGQDPEKPMPNDKQDFEPEHSEIAALKRYVDDQVDRLKQRQERQWLEALQSVGIDRETIEKRVDALASHGMSRRAALGAIAAATFGVGVLTGSAAGEPGDDGDTVWGSDANRDDYYADEIDALSIATEQVGIGDTRTRTESLLGSAIDADHSTQAHVDLSISEDIQDYWKWIIEGTIAHDDDFVTDLVAQMRVNGDSGQNYKEHRIDATNGVTVADNQTEAKLLSTFTRSDAINFRLVVTSYERRLQTDNNFQFAVSISPGTRDGAVWLAGFSYTGSIDDIDSLQLTLIDDSGSGANQGTASLLVR